MISKEKDYYAIMQVTPDAEQEVIEAAYRALARKYDPSTSKYERSTSRKRKARLRRNEVEEAFQVLGDRKKRAEYDRLCAKGSASRIFAQPYVWTTVGLAGIVIVILALVFTGTLGSGKEGGAGEPTTGGSPTTSAITNELLALGTQWQKTVAKVSYDITNTSGGTTDKGSITLYRHPPDWRMDISSSQGGEIMIGSASALYYCSAQSGANQCLSYDPSQYDVSAPLDLFDPNATATNLSGEDVGRSEQTIAGESATCFSITSTVEESTTKNEWCFASDGVLLEYTETWDDPDSGYSYTLEATSANRNVTDADFDFQPPYPVTPYMPSSSPTPSEMPASPTPVQ